MGKPVRFWANRLASFGFVRRKTRKPRTKPREGRLLACEFLEPRCLLSGVTLLWDPGHTGPASGPSGGTGTWDTTTSNWFDGTSDVAWAAGDTAVFANTAGNVIVAGAVDAAVIQFQSGGYILSPQDGDASLAAEATGTQIDVAGCAATIAAPFTGSGGLIVDGGGALTLAGANTYAGATVVDAGVLDFAAAAAAPAGGALTVNAGRALVGPASLFCDAGSSGTWAAAAWQLGGSGGPAVPWIDGSDAVISGSNTTITLSSAVSAGSITFTGGGCTIQSAAAGDTLTTSAIDVETGTTTISAVVAGGNGLFVTGPGTLVLTATSAYTGGTIIDQGSTLQIGSGGIAGSINADAGDGIVDNGSLIFDRSDNPAAYTGAISGSGNVVVAGGGTVTLSGGNTFTGGTVIASGTLDVGWGAPPCLPAGKSASAAAAQWT